MADQPENPGSRPPAGKQRLNSEESVWGSEWEEAFKAQEDAPASAHEEDFFLESSVAGPGGAISPAGEGRPDARPVTPAGRAFSVALLLSAVQEMAAALFRRGRALPASRLVFAGLATFACLAIIAGFLITRSKVPAPAIPTSPDQEAEFGELPPPEEEAEPLSPPAEQLSSPAEADHAATPAPASTGTKLRQKWGFSPFLIPITDKTSGSTTYLHLEVTLYLVMDEGEKLPEEKKILARDLIYRFFLSQSRDDLRRYALARGEMAGKLQDWLRERWPESPVASIIFNRYQLS